MENDSDFLFFLTHICNNSLWTRMYISKLKHVQSYVLLVSIFQESVKILVREVAMEDIVVRI